MIALSHLCPYLFDVGDVHRPFKEFGANASCPVVRVDGDGDDVSIGGVDDVPQDLAFFLTDRVDIDQEGLRIEMVEVDESSPIIRGFGKGLGFDLEDSIKVREGEGPDHWHFFVP